MFGSIGGHRRRVSMLVAGITVIAATASCSTSAPAPTPAIPTSPPYASSPPSASPEACPVDWGSDEAVVPATGTAALVAARAATGGCADRVEFDLDGPAAGYAVRYVDAVVQDGSGAELLVPGGARLQVQLHHPAYDPQAQATLPGRVGDQLDDVRGLPTLQSVVFGGSFEGYSTIGVGVRARLPFRVSIVMGLDGRSRIVLEIAHRWS